MPNQSFFFSFLCLVLCKKKSILNKVGIDYYCLFTLMVVGTCSVQVPTNTLPATDNDKSMVFFFLTLDENRLQYNPEKIETVC